MSVDIEVWTSLQSIFEQELRRSFALDPKFRLKLSKHNKQKIKTSAPSLADIMVGDDKPLRALLDSYLSAVAVANSGEIDAMIAARIAVGVAEDIVTRSALRDANPRLLIAAIDLAATANAIGWSEFGRRAREKRDTKGRASSLSVAQTKKLRKVRGIVSEIIARQTRSLSRSAIARLVLTAMDEEPTPKAIAAMARYCHRNGLVR